MIKYKYEFVRVKARFLSREPSQDYQEIINNKAKDGWKFIQIFSPGTGYYGTAGYYELIFEKENQF